LIETVGIDGFKSLINVSVDIKPVTILIGLNSSGKSSFLHLLEILKQTAQASHLGGLVTQGPLLNLGSFDDVVNKAGTREICIRIGGSRKGIANSPFRGEIQYGCNLVVDHEGLKCQDAGIVTGGFDLSGAYRRGKPEKIERPVSNGLLVFETQGVPCHPFKLSEIRGNPDSEVVRLIQNQLLEVISADLNDFFMVPSVRGLTSPSYPLDNKASSDLIDPSNLYAQSIKFVSTIVYESKSIETKINKWMGKVTNVAVRARTVPDRQGSIEVSRKFDVNVVNEGFGTNQLIHMFAQIAKANAYSLIGIEEPEVHLHPKAQSELAKVFIEIAREEKKNLILATHSEHILYRLLIEVAKGNLKTKDLAIYHFRLSEEGTTKVEKLDVDAKGRLDKGIPDFFETDLDEFKDFLAALKV
jgi:hypothetical protein